MKHQQIYAQPETFNLLEGGQPKLIGFVRDGQHYVNGGCIVPLLIVLHYGTKSQDHFFFENNNLSYNNVYMGREGFLQEKYSELAKRQELTPEVFLKEITECYTLHGLGFKQK